MKKAFLKVCLSSTILVAGTIDTYAGANLSGFSFNNKFFNGSVKEDVVDTTWEQDDEWNNEDDALTKQYKQEKALEQAKKTQAKVLPVQAKVLPVQAKVPSVGSVVPGNLPLPKPAPELKGFQKKFNEKVGAKEQFKYNEHKKLFEEKVVGGEAVKQLELILNNQHPSQLEIITLFETVKKAGAPVASKKVEELKARGVLKPDTKLDELRNQAQQVNYLANLKKDLAVQALKINPDSPQQVEFVKNYIVIKGFEINFNNRVNSNKLFKYDEHKVLFKEVVVGESTRQLELILNNQHPNQLEIITLFETVKKAEAHLASKKVKELKGRGVLKPDTKLEELTSQAEQVNDYLAKLTQKLKEDVAVESLNRLRNNLLISPDGPQQVEFINDYIKKYFDEHKPSDKAKASAEIQTYLSDIFALKGKDKNRITEVVEEKLGLPHSKVDKGAFVFEKIKGIQSNMETEKEDEDFDLHEVGEYKAHEVLKKELTSEQKEKQQAIMAKVKAQAQAQAQSQTGQGLNNIAEGVTPSALKAQKIQALKTLEKAKLFPVQKQIDNDLFTELGGLTRSQIEAQKLVDKKEDDLLAAVLHNSLTGSDLGNSNNSGIPIAPPPPPVDKEGVVIPKSAATSTISSASANPGLGMPIVPKIIIKVGGSKPTSPAKGAALPPPLKIDAGTAAHLLAGPILPPPPLDSSTAASASLPATGGSAGIPAPVIASGPLLSAASAPLPPPLVTSPAASGTGSGVPPSSGVSLSTGITTGASLPPPLVTSPAASGSGIPPAPPPPSVVTSSGVPPSSGVSLSTGITTGSSLPPPLVTSPAASGSGIPPAPPPPSVVTSSGVPPSSGVSLSTGITTGASLPPPLVTSPAASGSGIPPAPPPPSVVTSSGVPPSSGVSLSTGITTGSSLPPPLVTSPAASGSGIPPAPPPPSVVTSSGVPPSSGVSLSTGITTGASLPPPLVTSPAASGSGIPPAPPPPSVVTSSGVPPSSGVSLSTGITTGSSLPPPLVTSPAASGSGIPPAPPPPSVVTSSGVPPSSGVSLSTGITTGSSLPPPLVTSPAASGSGIPPAPPPPSVVTSSGVPPSSGVSLSTGITTGSSLPPPLVTSPAASGSGIPPAPPPPSVVTSSGVPPSSGVSLSTGITTGASLPPPLVTSPAASGTGSSVPPSSGASLPPPSGSALASSASSTVSPVVATTLASATSSSSSSASTSTSMVVSPEQVEKEQEQLKIEKLEAEKVYKLKIELEERRTQVQQEGQTILKIAEQTSEAISDSMGNINQALNDLGSNIETRMEGMAPGIASGSEYLKEVSIWSKAFFEKASKKTTKDSAGFKSSRFGGTFGADTLINEKNLLGMAISHARFDTKYKNGLQNILDANVITAYWSLYVNDRFFMNSQASYGFINSEVKSSKVAFKNKAHSFGFKETIGYNVVLQNDFILTPTVGLAYSKRKLNDAKINNSSLKFDNFNSFNSNIGLSVAKIFESGNTQIIPQANIGFEKSLASRGGAVKVASDSEGIGYDAVKMQKKLDNTLNLGTGVNIITNKKLEAGVDYKFSKTGPINAHGGSLKLKLKF